MEDRWARLEEIVRRVVREEIASLAAPVKKQQVTFGNGKWIGVTQEHLTAWAEAYGGCDIQAELKKAAAWIVSNPSLAPKTQFGRFLNTWLSKQQMTSAIRSIPTRSDQMKLTCAYCQLPSTGKVNGYSTCDAHFRKAMDHEKPARSA